MSTRAYQFDFLLAGLIHPTTLAPLAGGVIYFYAAGTTTAKNVWSEKEKTNPFTSITLGSDGTAQYYGEGIYKVVVKNSAETSTLYTWDDVKCLANNYYVRSVSTNTTATTDDDFISVNTDSGNITITLPAAADVTHPLIIKNTGANNVIVDGDGSETIDGSATYTITIEDAAVIFTSNGTNWAKANDTAPYAATLTGMTANVADLNKVPGIVAGSQALDGLDVNGDGDVSGTLTATSLKTNGNYVVEGLSTSRAVLRSSQITFQVGTTPGTHLDVALSASIFQGDTDSASDLAKDSTVGNWSMNSAGTLITLDSAALSGNCLAVVGFCIYRCYIGATHYTLRVRASSNDMLFEIYTWNAAPLNALDWTSVIGDVSELMYGQVTYLTDA